MKKKAIELSQGDVLLKDGDYTLIDGSAWFSVKNISIRIFEMNGGVEVAIYALHEEMADPLATASASFDEANAVIEETQKQVEKENEESKA